MEPRLYPREPREVIEIERECPYDDCDWSGYVMANVWGIGIEWACPLCRHEALEEEE
jgi:hypothetical protein